MGHSKFDSAVKTRVSTDVKAEINRIAESRQLSEADIVREAIRELLLKTPAARTPNPVGKRR